MGNSKSNKSNSTDPASTSTDQWECVCSTLNEGPALICKICFQPRYGNDGDDSFYADPHYIDDEDLKMELDSYEDVNYKKGYADKVRSNLNSKPNNADIPEITKNGWSAAGGKKCPCGSGKKFKKCCKKLGKYQNKIVVVNGRNPTNGNHNNGVYTSNGDSSGLRAIEERVESLEREVKQFQGPKHVRNKAQRELQKLKDQRNKLRRKMEQETREMQSNGKKKSNNGQNGRNGNANVNSTANQVIAI